MTSERPSDGDGPPADEDEFTLTDRYERDETEWYVLTSMEAPLVEIHVPEDVLTTVEA